MEEKVNIKKALRVFQNIVTDGKKIGDEYHLNGLVACTDFDGYTATIRNDYVTLDIFFHNKISFKYSNRKEKASFLQKIDALDK